MGRTSAIGLLLLVVIFSIFLVGEISLTSIPNDNPMLYFIIIAMAVNLIFGTIVLLAVKRR